MVKGEIENFTKPLSNEYTKNNIHIVLFFLSPPYIYYLPLRFRISPRPYIFAAHENVFYRTAAGLEPSSQ